MSTVMLLNQILPGIQRDGTDFSSKAYVDGEWIRFYDSRPRKRGGFKLLNGFDLLEIPRNLFSTSIDNTINLFCGTGSSLPMMIFDLEGNIKQTAEDRVPSASDGFLPSPQNQWTFDVVSIKIDFKYVPYVVAQVSPTVNDTASKEEGGIFYGPVNSNTKLKPSRYTPEGGVLTYNKTSGGIVVIGAYLFLYGNSGEVAWTDEVTGEDSLNSFPNTMPISANKIVAGRSCRGSVSPVGLFWSLNSLVVLTKQQDDTPSFSQVTVSKTITILSSNAISEYNQCFYWWGINGELYVYNGTVQKIDNTYNSIFFKDTIEFSYKEKSYSFVDPTFSELYLFYPKKNKDGQIQKECNHAIVYSLNGGYFYDVPFNECQRSCATYPDNYRYPIMGGSKVDYKGFYNVWTHEYGWDKETPESKTIIKSSFTTKDFMAGKDGQSDVQLRSRRIEPDIDQMGDMNVYVLTRAFANGVITSHGPYSFSKLTPHIDLSCQGRISRYVFESNTLGGWFQVGDIIVDIDGGDVRPGS